MLNVRTTMTVMCDYNNAYTSGYKQALADVKELLDNASQNGEILHYYHELVDQLIVLEDHLND